MMSLTFGLFTQVSGSGPLGPLVRENNLLHMRVCVLIFSLLRNMIYWRWDCRKVNREFAASYSKGMKKPRRRIFQS